MASDIAKVAKERKVDQVIMGTRGWSGALGLGVTLGSVSTAVLQRVNCPVTLVRELQENKAMANVLREGSGISADQPLATP